MKKEKFNAFEGKRYTDYDDKHIQKIIFNNKKYIKCGFCPKKLKIYEGFWGYNYLLCKKCYEKFCKQAEKEVDREFTNI